MSLKEIDENLVDLFGNKKFDLLIHQCNCFNTMGAGIARTLSLYYPEIAEADRLTIPGDINKLGTYQAVQTKDGIIVNMYTQYHYGLQHGTTPTSYMALRQALKQLAREYKGLKIGTYQLGCNRGGADWSKVKPILSSTIAHQNDVLVVNYKELV